MELSGGGEPEGSRYRHEMFLYDEPAGYLAGTVPFIRDGLAAGSPVLVAVPATRLEALAGHLPTNEPLLTLLALEDLGRNPARMIPVWADFLERWEGRPTRGIGEPLWPARTPDEAVEWEHHEALLNTAFDPAPDLWLRCPCDTASLGADVLAGVHRTHPHLATATSSTPNDSFELSSGFPDAPLPGAPEGAEWFTLDLPAVRPLRHHARRFALEAGLPAERSGEFEVAVSEAVTNVVLHGGASGVVGFWRDDSRVTCEVTDRGCGGLHPHLGRRRPPRDRPSGRGLWIIQQLCDLVQIRSHDVGTTIRLHMTL